MNAGPGSTVRKYDAVADDIRSKVLNGVYTDRVPGERAIAKEYGVNVTTANKAVASLVDEGVLERVRGRGTFVTRLKRPQTGTLAVVVDDVEAPLQARIVQGMDTTAVKRGKHLLFRSHKGCDRREYDFIDELIKEQKVDGFLVWPTTFALSSCGLKRLRQSDVPFVVLPHVEPFMAPHVNSVVSNDWEGARMAVQHLIDLGHRSIVFVHPNAWERDNLLLRNRWRGYCEAMTAAGLEALPPIVPEVDGDDPVRRGQVVTRAVKFSAAFCVTDDLAIDTVRVFEGLVPDKTSIVGLDGTPRAEDFDLTTVEQPMEDIGRMAVDVLLDEIEGRAKEPARVEVLPKLVVRGSTAKV